MPVINVRELARRTSAVIAGVASTRKPALVMKGGRPVAAVVPIDPDALEDWVLAHAPEFVRSIAEGEADLRAGRTISLAEFLASPAARGDTIRSGRRVPRAREAGGPRPGVGRSRR